ncbi:hypothetical protein [Clostridium cochlearium]|uniref:Uncharacterized protein n=1 Tax=Clostridium cochlearium TaxID=1494 RepID=A0A239ZKZ2_CLOCO|nr:hypothetical protein [Clostridium cochlearium]MBV1820588.1 hypothetical protein [Bacteroidales bacterium MSK.15.36]NSJ90270.1 hypothetical protein [Coprococcus sp. MSK.21.13]MBU5269642.1 hypothetical protein [Clostridium cochlearium]MCG4572509.1 hypothetical protein [Clostridium cochlearium]MCG4578778.1 hypothetical protein [Clostridium cochlearium]
MGRDKIDTVNEKEKIKSMISHDMDSLNSKTGYKNQGNPTEVQGKARAMRK